MKVMSSIKKRCEHCKVRKILRTFYFGKQFNRETDLTRTRGIGRTEEDQQEKERLSLHHLLSESETQAEARIIKPRTGGKTTGTRLERRNARCTIGVGRRRPQFLWSVKRKAWNRRITRWSPVRTKGNTCTSTVKLGQTPGMILAHGTL
jgi:hypothetical protein